MNRPLFLGRKGLYPSARWMPALVNLLLIGSVGACQSPEQDQELRGSPRAQVERWVEMWNSYDLDEVRELFLDDPRLTYFSSEKEGIIRGMEALLEHHRGFGFVSGGEERPSRLWMEDLETDLYGDLALVTGIWYFQSDEIADGTEGEGALPQRGPVTIVAVWRSGEWRFAHMNFSEYLPPDSN